jgi:hypothetical protein
MSNNRWSKFDWHAWSDDPALRLVSLQAQGLWMRLLCIAHDANPVGHVLVGGKKPTPTQLAKIVGTIQDESTSEPRVRQDRAISKLIDELVRSNVCDITSDGVLVSRRMVRDEKIHQRAVSIGKLGGNPNVTGAKKVEKQVNQQVNQRANGLVNPDSDSDSDSPKVPASSRDASAGTSGAQPKETIDERVIKALTAVAAGDDKAAAKRALKRLAQLRAEAAAPTAPFRGTVH